MTLAWSSHWRSRALGAGIFTILVLELLLSFRSDRPRFLFASRSSGPAGSEGFSVFVANISRDFSYGLLERYWGENAGEVAGKRRLGYPENPLYRQYSAEYWLLGDLLAGENGAGSRRVVGDAGEADVIFVPFFAALSAEMQLERNRGKFRHRKENEDYERQRRVLEQVKSTPQWAASNGRDHVFVLTDPVAMWHSRSELKQSILLFVDFGGWYMEDARLNSSDSLIHHSQVSLIKDVIVPYTHLLPTLTLQHDTPRTTLLYFKGARFRHRTGLVRDQLWKVLEGETGVVLEAGFPNSTGQAQAIRGMRSSEFCLHPAGDTPTSCRLFDAVASLCVPVIVSDSVELPFEGMIDYTLFSVFVSVSDALQPGWLVSQLRGISRERLDSMRLSLAEAQRHFEYESGPGAATIRDGAVDMIWKKVASKVPGIKEEIARNRRRPRNGVLPPARCHCVQ